MVLGAKYAIWVIVIIAGWQDSDSEPPYAPCNVLEEVCGLSVVLLVGELWTSTSGIVRWRFCLLVRQSIAALIMTAQTQCARATPRRF